MGHQQVDVSDPDLRVFHDYTLPETNISPEKKWLEDDYYSIIVNDCPFWVSACFQEQNF